MTLIKSISGIRGTIGGKNGESLSPIDIVRFSAAYGTWVNQSPGDSKKVILGRDSRITGPMVAQLVCSTLQAMGIDIIDLGLATTPTVEMAVMLEKAAGGIIISASHNPFHWNALKLLNDSGEFMSPEESQKILIWAKQGDFEFCEPKQLGGYTADDSYLQKHIDLILDLPRVDQEAIQKRKFKVVVDGVNSVGGIAVPALLRALGVEEIKEMYCEPTGIFAHNPEPLSENLTDISRELKKGDYDLGIVVDPDADRLAFICEDGSMFGEEYTLVAVAEYILQHQAGSTVSNLSSTRALRDITQKAGQQYYSSAVGEVHVVNKMKEVSAVIGGEGNGGIIYPDLHYGRDALVGIALFLSHLAHFAKPISHLRATYPNYLISKNKISLTPEIDLDFVLMQIEEQYKNNPLNLIDGVKIEFEDSWVHLRKSNTEPIIRIYSEADSITTAENLSNKIIQDVKDILNNANV